MTVSFHKFGDYFPRSEDYMVSGVEWNYKKLCSVTTVEFHDCSKQVLEMESQIQDKSRKLPAQVAGIFFDITEKLQHFKDLGVGGEVAKVGLDMKNLIACTCFLLEQKLVKAWLVDKYAEALRCQKLLVGGSVNLLTIAMVFKVFLYPSFEAMREQHAI
nr:Aminopeptidase N [Ipomoea batatas]